LTLRATLGGSRAIVSRIPRTWPVDLGFGGLLALLGWPYVSVAARDGLDPSWQLALRLAISDHLTFGRDVVFTYGPLGFLGYPVPTGGLLTALAFVASGTVYALLAAYAVHVLRRMVALPEAFLGGLVVSRLFGELWVFEASQVLVAVVAFEVLAERLRPPPVALALTAGAVAGAFALAKGNVALTAGLMLAIVVLATSRPWWRGAAIALGSGALTFVGLWLLTGQDVAAVPGYVRGAFELVSGYSQAMGKDRFPGRLWLYVAFVVVVAVDALIVWRMSRDWPTRRRIGAFAVGLVFAFSLWKIGFVRMYPAIAAASLLIWALAGLSIARVNRRIALVALVVPLTLFVVTSPRTKEQLLDVRRSVLAGLYVARDSLWPPLWPVVSARTESELRDQYALPAGMLAQLGGKSVHFDPWEVGVAVAYPEIRWDPLPTVQSYTAYTPWLDELAAARLASPEAPDMILRSLDTVIVNGETKVFTVDERFRWWESPAAMLETFCRYREVAVDARWQVLVRTAASCRDREVLGTTTVGLGVSVSVPVDSRPNRIVVARIQGVNEGLLNRLRDGLYRAPVWYATLDGNRYRIVPGTVGEGVLLSVPTAADGSDPFAFGPSVRSITVTAEGFGAPTNATITFVFESVPWPGVAEDGG